ncbi:uncharacterized protein LOC120110782 [Phoenix dactylifera]|uniref:Coatomer subunit zeta n=1 Tax=Phoenix dactylifera TaxID=42345 RepID=A0A8B9AEC0_PHODC|nr:uncharacterized protein LOC120110782 [Phoenix dactylifera]
MILAVLFANTDGNILIERFHGVPAEERLHWRSFLVKLGADNLKGATNEELFVASHNGRSAFVITSTVKDVCGKLPTERLFLDKYGKICLCLDEIVWTGMLENTDKDRIRKVMRLRPPTEA